MPLDGVAFSLAYVASVSVGFQSRKRPKNEILIILPRKKWERVKKWSEGGGGKELWNKKWSRGRGEEGKETLASKGCYFEKPRSPANGANSYGPEISSAEYLHYGFFLLVFKFAIKALQS